MRIAIITGASSGIGKEFALQIPGLYKQLDEIWIISRSENKLIQLKNQVSKKFSGTIRCLDLDLTNPVSISYLEEELHYMVPDIRMLVNAAGMGKIGSVSEIDSMDLSNTISINCTALTIMTKICLPYLSKGSRIINVASASAFSPQPDFAVYAASKAYVYSFSRAIEREIKGKGIIVTTVCPGPVDTPFFETAGEIKESKKKYLARPELVVRQALLDTKRGKHVSIYGKAMKGSRILSKVLPDVWIMECMKIMN